MSEFDPRKFSPQGSMVDAEPPRTGRPALMESSAMVRRIDGIVLRASASFTVDIERTLPFGRENEAVNLFSFRHLIERVARSPRFARPGRWQIEDLGKARTGSTKRLSRLVPHAGQGG